MLTALPGGVKRHFPIALVVTFCLGPLQCATLERLSLDDMISKSTGIVRGKIVSSTAAFAPAQPVIYTHYAIQVSERFKGPAGSTIDVVVPGGVVNNVRQSFPGAPSFRTGDEYVFFLWTSKAGLTQVIGLTQGLFSLPGDGSADPMATRSASHELMLDRSTGQPVKDQPLVMRLSELRSRITSILGTPVQGVSK